MCRSFSDMVILLSVGWGDWYSREKPQGDR